MSKESFIIILGIVVILLPSLGIPSQWKTYGFVGVGVLCVLVGYQLRYARYLRSIDRGNGERGSDSFVESTGLADNAAHDV